MPPTNPLSLPGFGRESWANFASAWAKPYATFGYQQWKKKNIIFPIEISHLGVYVGIPHFGGETSENHVTSCDHHTRDNHMDGKFNHIQVSRGGATPWLIFDFSANKNVLCIMQL
jgi:hypothetical protein